MMREIPRVPFCPVENFLYIACRACYYGLKAPDVRSIVEEYRSGVRIASMASAEDVSVILSGRLCEGDILSIDTFYSAIEMEVSPGRTAGLLRRVVRDFKAQAVARGVKHVYTMVHYKNPQSAQLKRFYCHVMGFKPEAQQLYAPIEWIKDL